MDRLYEIRSRKEILKSIQRNRIIDKNQRTTRHLRPESLGDPGDPEYGDTVNNCAIKSFCHATGEKPGRVLNYLLRHERFDKVWTDRSHFFRRDQPTHPRVITKMAKKFGYRFKKMPEDLHRQKFNFGSIPKTARKYSTIPIAAQEVSKKLKPGKKYIAITRLSSGHKHTFNLDHKGATDYFTDLSDTPIGNANYYHVHHLYEVQKDPNHPRWNWKPRGKDKMNEARSKDEIIKSIASNRILNSNLRARASRKDLMHGDVNFGGMGNVCAVNAFCNATGEKPGRVLNHLLRTEKLNEPDNRLVFKRDSSTHPRVIQKLGKKFGWKFVRAPTHFHKDENSTLRRASEVVKRLPKGKKYVGVKGNIMPHVFNLDHRGATDDSVYAINNNYNPDNYLVHHLFSVEKDLRHPRWNWKPRLREARIRSKKETYRDYFRNTVLHRNLRFMRVWRDHPGTGDKGLGDLTYACAIRSFCHATGEHPHRVLNYLLRHENLHDPDHGLSFRREHPTHPRVIQKMAKKFGYKLKRVPEDVHTYHHPKFGKTSWEAQDILHHLKHGKKYIGVTKDLGDPHTFNIDSKGVADHSDVYNMPENFRVHRLYSVEKDLRHPRWNWKPRKGKMNEARSKDEILRNIQRIRETPPKGGPQTPLERWGNEPRSGNSHRVIRNTPNTCAIMSAAHATGEDPIKIYHRLIRDHEKYPQTPLSYRPGRVTHPLAVAHVLKKLGYRMNRVPKEKHGEVIHHHSQIFNPWYEILHPEDEDHKKVEEFQKKIFHQLNDSHPSKKPFQALKARDIIHDGKVIKPGRKYIALTHDLHDEPSMEHIDSASGKRIYLLHNHEYADPLVHAFNIESGKARDHNRSRPNEDPNEFQVSHLFEVQKDLKHPRWRWKPRKMNEARSKYDILRSIKRLKDLHNNLEMSRYSRDARRKHKEEAPEWGNTVNMCAIKSFCHATGEHPHRVLNHLLRHENMHDPYRGNSQFFRRDKPTHPRVIQKLAKKFGYRLKRVPREHHAFKETDSRGRDRYYGYAAETIHPNLKPGKKYIAVTNEMGEPHTFNLDHTGAKDHTILTDGGRIPDDEVGKLSVDHLFEVQKDLRHPRWNWKPRQTNESKNEITKIPGRDDTPKDPYQYDENDHPVMKAEKIRRKKNHDKIKKNEILYGDAADIAEEMGHRHLATSYRDFSQASGAYRDSIYNYDNIAFNQKRGIGMSRRHPASKDLEFWAQEAGERRTAMHEHIRGRGLKDLHKLIMKKAKTRTIEGVANPYEPKKIGFVKEARTRDEIWKSIKRNRLMMKNSHLPFEKRGRRRYASDGIPELGHTKNTCAVKAFCHATGEKPSRVLNYLLRHEKENPEEGSSFSYTRDMPTHPRILAKLGKKFGWKFKRAPETLHTDTVPGFDRKWPKTAGEVYYKLPKRKKYIALTKWYGIGGNNLPHAFNISREGPRDFTDTHPSNVHYKSIHHLFEVQKDLSHPRWNWKRRRR